MKRKEFIFRVVKKHLFADAETLYIKMVDELI